jgi:hypothetical protein
MCEKFNSKFKYGMFAILKIYQYIIVESPKETYNMKLFKNCKLDTKFTCNKRCLLEFAIFHCNEDIVQILIDNNCNIIDNDSFVYAIVSYLNYQSEKNNKPIQILKLILHKLKNYPIEKTKTIIKNGLEIILKEKNHYNFLIKLILNQYPTILKYVELSYRPSVVNPDNFYLIKNPIICLKFNRFNFKLYDNNIQKNIKLYLSIMNKLNVLPPEICEYILEYVELDKLKLKKSKTYWVC